MSENPAVGVVDAVENTLLLAQSWIHWDGRSRVSDDGAREYTPSKVIRRLADHIIDHLAEVEELLIGHPRIPDEWQASTVTFDSELVLFSQTEYLEAVQRLRRLARIFFLRYEVVGPQEWDLSRGESWTLREIAEHLSSTWYAAQLGDMSPR